MRYRQKAIFLDRDGIVNRVIIREGKHTSPRTFEEFELNDGIENLLKEAKALGFLTIIITNQPEVKRGLLKQEELERMHHFLKKKLPIDDILVCLHDNDDNCNCRKPQPGMIFAAIQKWNIDPRRSFLLGDTERDIGAAKNAGLKTIILNAFYNEEVEADFRIRFLSETVQILRKANTLQEIQLGLVEVIIVGLNFILEIIRRTLFVSCRDPKQILIYKIGNIGDIICAVPAIIAIRRAYPNAKLTLLTSPGERWMSGAKEFLLDVWYLDDLKVYYRDEINSLTKKITFVRRLKRENYDLFIQVPDDLVNFQTLIRNMIFAKAIGAKSAIGFKVRTIQIFKKTQVDYSSQETETKSLLNLLKENGITSNSAEFDFNLSSKEKERLAEIIKNLKLNKKDILIALGPGGKREANRWPAERFRDVTHYLLQKYNAKIVIVGGRDDIEKAKTIKDDLLDKNVFIVAGQLSFLETLELLKSCAFLISNSTGTIHLGAAAGIPAIGLYTVRDILGRWFPYGDNHKILYHKFLDCNYRDEKCIKKSIEMISVDEVKQACDEIITRIKQDRF